MSRTSENREGYRYSQKTLKMANHKFSDKSSALERVVEYFKTEFRGIDIDRKCIRAAFEACFNGANSQEMLNLDVKNYLLKNLSRM